MPVKINDDLPAYSILESENIFVMSEQRADTQDIRPLKILIMNLMPTKVETETQLLRLLSNSPLQTDVEFLQAATHESKNTSQEYLERFYHTFDEVRNKKYDGMIITGAPVECIDFSDVDYWDELCEIMDWTRTNVCSTLYICWGSQAGPYHHSGIVASSPVSGVGIVVSEKNEVFITGHFEYDRGTLAYEYERDMNAGMNPHVPDNYFEDDDPTKDPVFRWRSHATLFFTNWLNYHVYQQTPYDIEQIGKE